MIEDLILWKKFSLKSVVFIIDVVMVEDGENMVRIKERKNYKRNWMREKMMEGGERKWRRGRERVMVSTCSGNLLG